MMAAEFKEFKPGPGITGASYLTQQARRRVVGSKDTAPKATGRLEIQVVGDIDTVAKTIKREATELTDAAAHRPAAIGPAPKRHPLE
jgi:hypothetical protein